jgi:hypothetical protein
MNVYTAPMRDAAPSGAPAAYTNAKTIDRLLRATDPDAVARSGRSYQDFANAYDKIAADLLTMGGDLNEAWQGRDAAAAQSQLREVWAATTTVQSTASRFGIAVERHGSESLWWYKHQMPATTNVSEAQSWMTGANERISQSWSSLPADISTTLPPPPKTSHYSPPASPALPTSGGSGGTALPAGLHAPGATGGHHAPGVTGGHHTPGSSLPGANLADFSSGSPTPLSSGLSTGGSGLPSGLSGAGGVGGVGGGPAIGGIGGASGLESGGLIGNPGNLSGGAAQNAAAAEEAQAAEASAASRPGLMGPMVGGGAGGGSRQEQEHRRDTWLAEEQETWASDDVAPQVIGAVPAEPEPEPEPQTEADPPSDDIADLLDELGDDQPADPAIEIAALRARLEALERQAGTESAVQSTGEEGATGLGWMSGDGI